MRVLQAEVWKRGLRGLGSGEGCREKGESDRSMLSIGSGVSRMEEEQLSGGVCVWIGGTTSMEGI